MAAPIPTAATVSDALALAIVSSSDAPLLLLDGELLVIAASTSFCRAFDIDPATTSSLSVFDLGEGEWNLPRLRSLLKATASGHADIEAYETDLHVVEGADRRLVIKARRLDYDAAAVRLMVTVSDVTDARLAEQLKNGLLREKAILIQEVQHRVANSLQIIASVLLQSARKVQSEETRSYLHDAHSRVMSIATVQRQLAVTHQDTVELAPYFTQLCDSLGASMIQDHKHQAIEVRVEGSAVGGDFR